MKLFTFTVIDECGDSDTFVIEADRKPTIKQAIKRVYSLDDQEIDNFRQQYLIKITPAIVIERE